MPKQLPAAYLAYLQSPHWCTLKTKLRGRAHNRCEACDHDGRLWPLDGHHLAYREPLDTCTCDDLILLCRRCHDIVHDLDIPVLFQHGTPLHERRARTLAEIRRYLPDLDPPSTRTFRIPLPTPPRHVHLSSKIVHRSRRAENRARKLAKKLAKNIPLALADNERLRLLQAHLPRNPSLVSPPSKFPLPEW